MGVGRSLLSHLPTVFREEVYNTAISPLPTVVGERLRRLWSPTTGNAPAVLGRYSRFGGTEAPRPQIELGLGCKIREHVVMAGRVTIGDHALIFPYVYLLAGSTPAASIRIGRDSLLAPAACIRSTFYNYRSRSRPICEQGMADAGVVIGDDVWVGMRAHVMPGSTIGDGAVIGACSVVCGDIEPYHVVAGIPARTISIRGE